MFALQDAGSAPRTEAEVKNVAAADERNLERDGNERAAARLLVVTSRNATNLAFIRIVINSV